MQKATQQHFAKIVDLLQNVLGAKTPLHKFDTVYIQKALDSFVANRNITQLYQTLANQDGIVREYCADVINYIKQIQG
jgi:hypothetical protein